MKKTAHSLAAMAAFVLLHLFPSSSNAAICTKPYVYMLKAPATVTFNSAAAVGSTLWTGQVQATASTGDGDCAAGRFTVEMKGTGAPLTWPLYDSGVPGIGYRMRSSDLCHGGWWPGSCTSYWEAGPAAHRMTIELVKTGPISAGGTLSGMFAEWRAEGEQYLRYMWSEPVIVKPNIPTCSSVTPSIPVPLGNIPAGRFTGIGSTSTSVGFTIALQCSGGEGSLTSNVYMTLTDQTNPGNRSDALSLADEATASGVGIQVKNSAGVVRFGPDSADVNNPNRWYAGKTGNGSFNIPMSASYVQTEPTVKGGSANGRATFTMSYQ